MAYAPTKYQDRDLVLKPDARPSSAVSPDVAYFQQAYNDLGGPNQLRVDGQLGPKTIAGILVFQEACALPRTGYIDQQTWDAIDWRVFGPINGSWTHFATQRSELGPGGRAFVSKDGYAYNVYTGLPVNANGQTREGQRLSDVAEAIVKLPLGYEGAVNRQRAGGGSSLKDLSRHALGLAGDDLADRDANRVITDGERVALKTRWDALFTRAQGFPVVRQTLVVTGPTDQRIFDMTWRGRDRLVTMVLGNVKAGGQLLFPGLRANRDVSWTAVRNAPKASLLSTVHVAPLHLHTDAAPGAPEGSPF